jgi:hypothetical protein
MRRSHNSLARIPVRASVPASVPHTARRPWYSPAGLAPRRARWKLTADFDTPIAAAISLGR